MRASAATIRSQFINGPRPTPRSLAFAMSCVLAAWPVQRAIAQDKPAETPAVGVLQPVTVTAERRTENIKDVPSAVSTLSGEKLDVLNSSGEDIRLLSGRVPSLNIESSFGRAFPRFYIRGYGNTDFRLNASQPVSLIYDDVVQENPILKGFPVFDLERVEVLAGPQGTLFGRNTPAGVVKFDSVKPGNKAEGYFNGGIGRFGAVNLEGAYTLPLSSEWSSRLSVQSQHRDDWVTNTNPSSPTHKLEGYDDNAARLQVAYTPRQEFSALFNVHARSLEGSSRVFRGNIIQPGTSNLVPGFDASKISLDGQNEQKLDTLGGSLKLKWALQDVTLYSITGYETVRSYSRGDVDGTSGPYVFFGPEVVFTPGQSSRVPSETADSIHDHGQLSQEFRVESAGSGALKWQAGVYLFHEKYGVDSYDYNTLGGSVQDGLVKTTQKNDAWAVFGGASYSVTSAFNVRAGLRYTHDKKTLETQPDASLQAANGFSKDTSDSKVSWDLSATYAVTTDVNVYARVATGFRGSSIQQPSAFAPLTFAGPERTTSYEVGLKGDLFDKRARTSVSLFHYDVKDQQLTVVGGGGNTNVLINAKKAMGEGLEATLDAYLTDNLLVTLNGSYNLTKIKDPTLAVGPCAACTILNPFDANGNVLINGNPLPQAPKYIANVTARYGIPTASGGEYFVYTDWSYRSEVNFFLYKSTEFTGKAMTIGGLRVGYTWADGKYEAAVFGRNITNQQRIVGGIDFTNLTGFINEPRTWGAQFKALF